LASITITVTGEFQANAVVHFDSSGLVSFLPILLPLLALALPLADLVLAVVRRTLAGKSPFAPDKKHLHHRLLELGHSHARAVLLMYLWAAIISFAAVSLSIFDAPAIVLSVTTLVAICAVGLITLPRLRRRALLRAKTRLATATDGSNSAEKK
ncbi:MAG: undecaprenyl/decaprenyl-phosphate alpha-N-acetylglucosaminyl 1-phosphate transferase, partial [Thermobifida fusca]|nr:undecaprenyl/decaprenyl-phosphate alpha-N-acetylglucosaminyl 1-phosphate transferase [Thermobifida fusca]